MAADPLKIPVTGGVRIVLCSATGIFGLSLVICKSDGCTVQPFVILGVSVGKVEAGGSSMKGCG